jgi:hypothetical protein
MSGQNEDKRITMKNMIITLKIIIDKPEKRKPSDSLLTILDADFWQNVPNFFAIPVKSMISIKSLISIKSEKAR